MRDCRSLWSIRERTKLHQLDILQGFGHGIIVAWNYYESYQIGTKAQQGRGSILLGTLQNYTASNLFMYETS